MLSQPSNPQIFYLILKINLFSSFLIIYFKFAVGLEQQQVDAWCTLSRLYTTLNRLTVLG